MVGQPTADHIVDLEIIVAVQLQRILRHPDACDMKIFCGIFVKGQHELSHIHRITPKKAYHETEQNAIKIEQNALNNPAGFYSISI